MQKQIIKTSINIFSKRSVCRDNLNKNNDIWGPKVKKKPLFLHKGRAPRRRDNKKGPNIGPGAGRRFCLLMRTFFPRV